MRIILLGPPGAGKGTVSQALETKFKLYHLSIGNVFRELVSKDTLIGRDIKDFIQKGKLVPNQFAVEIVKLDLSSKTKYILDGFPRDLDQAKNINNLDIEMVLFLDVKLELVIERLSGRRVCSKCGESFHEKFLPPKIEGCCNFCQGKLIRRKDDSPNSIKKRFEVYKKETHPLINFYKKKGILAIVDASPKPELVKKTAIKTVKEWFKKK